MRIIFLLSMACVINCVAMDLAPVQKSADQKMLKRAIIDNDSIAVQNMALNYALQLDIDIGLYIAIKYKRHKCMKILLENGAGPNVLSGDGMTMMPLHAVKTAKGAKLLLQHGAEVDAKDWSGNTPLSRSVFYRKKQWREIAQVLFDAGADINIRDKTYGSLLHYAAKVQNCGVADFVLGNEIDTTMRNNQGLTAFGCAVNELALYERGSSILDIFEHYGMAFFPKMRPRELLNIADLFMPNKFEQHNDVHVASLNKLARLFMCGQRYRQRSNAEDGITFNRYGCIVNNISDNDLEHYFGLDEKKGVEASLQALNKKLLRRIKKQDHAMVQYIIEKFPWVTKYDSKVTMLMMSAAIELQDTRCLEMLLKNNVQCSEHKHVNTWGTCLHEAVSRDNIPALPLLLEHGVDCLQKNIAGQTPLEYAAQLKKQSCAALLNKAICEKFGSAFLTKDYKKSKQLLSQIIDCNVIFGWAGYTLLHFIIGSDVQKVVKFIPLLVAKGADVNKVSAKGATVLWRFLDYLNDEKKQIPVYEALLKAGARVNRRSGIPAISLLNIALLRECYDLASLFLTYGAIVDKEMLDREYEGMPQTLKESLQQRYDEQECCICWEHPDDLSDIPCKRKHAEFLCKGCYDGLKKKCPMCCGQLGEL